MNLPAIVKSAETVLVALEEAVSRFPRYHKYVTGADLRREARAIVQLTHLAWNDRPRRAEHLEALSDAIDHLKISIRIAQRLQALRSFAEFEHLARLIVNLGQQCGGWRKRQRSKGQNRRLGEHGGRASILSARTASEGATP